MRDGDKVFDHRKHVDLLEEAMTYLATMGKDEMANAVGCARSIHIDEEGRIATLRQELKRLKIDNERITDTVRNIERYVSKPAGPWIGPDLFPLKEEH